VMFLCLGGMILVTLLRLDLAIEAERLPQVAVILADMVIVADVMMLVALFFLIDASTLSTLVYACSKFQDVQARAMGFHLGSGESPLVPCCNARGSFCLGPSTACLNWSVCTSDECLT